jgi:Domain of unknown function (DUF4375)
MISSASLISAGLGAKLMTLPLDLEDWLTDVGDQIVCKRASEGEAALSAREKLIYEIWLLDTEARNGGISQYFANRGMKQWEQCTALATAWPVPSFSAFAKRVSDLLIGNADPYLALIAREAEANEVYYAY